MSQRQRRRPRKKGRNFWGPPIWDTIHITAATLRPENADKFVSMLWNLSDLIPCDYCSVNLKEKLREHPPGPYLRNNHDAFFYSYLLHDLANQQITREHPDEAKVSPRFDDIKAYYFLALGEECKDCKV